MSKNHFSTIFDIPAFSYFQSGNPYYGSHGTLSYRIIPEDEIRIQVWHSKLCGDLAEIEAETTYPMTEDGMREGVHWLEEQI